jgi:lipopolysaccharide biosynthesis regulator YciM
MNFDLQWLLLGLPIAFALGWLGSRLDLRQWKREQHDSPKAYFKGLNLLLNEQQDKAIDAFIEAVQHDPDTSDLHFALGNLFRRRGEYERAVRVHQHLVSRADLPRSERDRAQHALSQDFMKAGLFDRAEEAYKSLEGTAFDTEARLALLTLHERSRDWRAAVEVAQKLEHTGTASFASRIAHYWCEIALEADARQHTAEADEALRQAREAAPNAARPMVLAGQRAHSRGDHAQALQLWGELLAAHPTTAFNLVTRDYAADALACGEQAAALERLQALYRRAPTMDLLGAIATLDPAPAAQRQRLLAHLQEQPTLSAAQELLRQMAAEATTLDADEAQGLRTAVSRAAKPLQRYRCAACGFEAQHYFWQCPGCLSWDSYPPQRLEDL